METKKRSAKFAKSEINLMSLTTRQFLQKICHKEYASVDMTQYGFMRDSKVCRVRLWIHPLFLQLQKICDKAEPRIATKQTYKRVRLVDSKIGPKVKKNGNTTKKRFK